MRAWAVQLGKGLTNSERAVLADLGKCVRLEVIQTSTRIFPYL